MLNVDTKRILTGIPKSKQNPILNSNNWASTTDNLKCIITNTWLRLSVEVDSLGRILNLQSICKFFDIKSINHGIQPTFAEAINLDPSNEDFVAFIFGANTEFSCRELRNEVSKLQTLELDENDIVQYLPDKVKEIVEIYRSYVVKDTETKYIVVNDKLAEGDKGKITTLLEEYNNLSTKVFVLLSGHISSVLLTKPFERDGSKVDLLSLITSEILTKLMSDKVMMEVPKGDQTHKVLSLAYVQGEMHNIVEDVFSELCSIEFITEVGLSGLLRDIFARTSIKDAVDKDDNPYIDVNDYETLFDENNEDSVFIKELRDTLLMNILFKDHDDLEEGEDGFSAYERHLYTTTMKMFIESLITRVIYDNTINKFIDAYYVARKISDAVKGSELDDETIIRTLSTSRKALAFEVLPAIDVQGEDGAAPHVAPEPEHAVAPIDHGEEHDEARDDEARDDEAPTRESLLDKPPSEVKDIATEYYNLKHHFMILTEEHEYLKSLYADKEHEHEEEIDELESEIDKLENIKARIVCLINVLQGASLLRFRSSGDIEKDISNLSMFMIEIFSNVITFYIANPRIAGDKDIKPAEPEKAIAELADIYTTAHNPVSIYDILTKYGQAMQYQNAQHTRRYAEDLFITFFEYLTKEFNTEFMTQAIDYTKKLKDKQHKAVIHLTSVIYKAVYNSLCDISTNTTFFNNNVMTYFSQFIQSMITLHKDRGDVLHDEKDGEALNAMLSILSVGERPTAFYTLFKTIDVFVKLVRKMIDVSEGSFVKDIEETVSDFITKSMAKRQDIEQFGFIEELVGALSAPPLDVEDKERFTTLLLKYSNGKLMVEHIKSLIDMLKLYSEEIAKHKAKIEKYQKIVCEMQSALMNGREFNINCIEEPDAELNEILTACQEIVAQVLASRAEKEDTSRVEALLSVIEEALVKADSDTKYRFFLDDELKVDDSTHEVIPPDPLTIEQRQDKIITKLNRVCKFTNGIITELRGVYQTLDEVAADTWLKNKIDNKKSVEEYLATDEDGTDDVMYDVQDSNTYDYHHNIKIRNQINNEVVDGQMTTYYEQHTVDPTKLSIQRYIKLTKQVRKFLDQAHCDNYISDVMYDNSIVFVSTLYSFVKDDLNDEKDEPNKTTANLSAYMFKAFKQVINLAYRKYKTVEGEHIDYLNELYGLLSSHTFFKDIDNKELSEIIKHIDNNLIYRMLVRKCIESAREVFAPHILSILLFVFFFMYNITHVICQNPTVCETSIQFDEEDVKRVKDITQLLFTDIEFRDGTYGDIDVEDLKTVRYDVSQIMTLVGASYNNGDFKIEEIVSIFKDSHAHIHQLINNILVYFVAYMGARQEDKYVLAELTDINLERGKVREAITNFVQEVIQSLSQQVATESDEPVGVATKDMLDTSKVFSSKTFEKYHDVIDAKIDDFMTSMHEITTKSLIGQHSPRFRHIASLLFQGGRTATVYLMSGGSIEDELDKLREANVDILDSILNTGRLTLFRDLTTKTMQAVDHETQTIKETLDKYVRLSSDTNHVLDCILNNEDPTESFDDVIKSLQTLERSEPRSPEEYAELFSTQEEDIMGKLQRAFEDMMQRKNDLEELKKNIADQQKAFDIATDAYDKNVVQYDEDLLKLESLLSRIYASQVEALQRQIGFIQSICDQLLSSIEKLSSDHPQLTSLKQRLEDLRSQLTSLPPTQTPPPNGKPSEQQFSDIDSKRAALDKLQEQIAKHIQEYNDIVDSIKSARQQQLQMQIEEDHSANDDLQKQIDELTEKLLLAEQTISELTAERDSLQQQLRDSSTKDPSYVQEYTKLLNSYLSERESELADIESNKANPSQEAITKLAKKMIETITKFLIVHESVLKKNSLYDLSSYIVSADNPIGTVINLLHTLISTISRESHSRLAEYARNYQTDFAKIVHSDTNWVNMQAKYREIKDEYEAIKQQHKDEVLELKTSIEKYKADAINTIKGLEEKIEALKKEKASLTQQLEDLRRELEVERSKSARAQSDVESLSAQLLALRSEHDKLKSSSTQLLDENSQKLKTLTDEHEDLKRKHDSMTTELTSLRDILLSPKLFNDPTLPQALTDRLRKLVAEYQKNKQTIEELQRRIAELTSENNSLTSANESLTSENKTLIQRHKTEVDALLAKVSALTEKINTLSVELEQYKTRCSELIAVKESLENQITTLKQNHSIELSTRQAKFDQELALLNKKLIDLQLEFDRKKKAYIDDADRKAKEQTSHHEKAIREAEQSNDQSLKTARQHYKDKIARIRAEHKLEKEKINSEHERVIESLKNQHEAKVNDLIDKHNAELDQLRQKHGEELSALEKRLSGTISELEAKNKELSDKLAMADHTFADSQDTITKLTKELSDLKATHSQAVADYDSLKASHDENLNALSQTKSELQATSSELEQTKATLSATSSELEQTKANLSTATSELEQARTSLTEQQNKYKRAITALNDKLKAKQSEYDTLNTTHREKMAKAQQLKARYESLKTEHATLQQQLQEQIALVNSLQEQNRQLLQDLDTANSSNEATSARLVDITNRLSIAESTIEELTAKQQNLEAQLTKTKKQAATFKKQAEASAAKIKELEKTIQDMQAEYDHLKQEHSALQSQLDTLNADLQDLINYANSLEYVYEPSKDKAPQMSKVEQLKYAIDQLNRSCSLFEEGITKVSSQSPNDLKKETFDMLHLNSLRAKNKQLQQQVQELTSSNKSLTVQLQTLTQTNTELSEAKQIADQQLAEHTAASKLTQQQRDATDKELQELKEDMRTVLEDNSRLLGELAQTRALIKALETQIAERDETADAVAKEKASIERTKRLLEAYNHAIPVLYNELKRFCVKVSVKQPSQDIATKDVSIRVPLAYTQQTLPELSKSSDEALLKSLHDAIKQLRQMPSVQFEFDNDAFKKYCDATIEILSADVKEGSDGKLPDELSVNISRASELIDGALPFVSYPNTQLGYVVVCPGTMQRNIKTPTSQYKGSQSSMLTSKVIPISLHLTISESETVYPKSIEELVAEMLRRRITPDGINWHDLVWQIATSIVKLEFSTNHNTLYSASQYTKPINSQRKTCTLHDSAKQNLVNIISRVIVGARTKTMLLDAGYTGESAIVNNPVAVYCMFATKLYVREMLAVLLATIKRLDDRYEDFKNAWLQDTNITYMVRAWGLNARLNYESQDDVSKKRIINALCLQHSFELNSELTALVNDIRKSERDFIYKIAPKSSSTNGTRQEILCAYSDDNPVIVNGVRIIKPFVPTALSSDDRVFMYVPACLSVEAYPIVQMMKGTDTRPSTKKMVTSCLKYHPMYDIGRECWLGDSSPEVGIESIAIPFGEVMMLADKVSRLFVSGAGFLIPVTENTRGVLELGRGDDEDESVASSTGSVYNKGSQGSVSSVRSEQDWGTHDRPTSARRQVGRETRNVGAAPLGRPEQPTKYTIQPKKPANDLVVRPRVKTGYSGGSGVGGYVDDDVDRDVVGDNINVNVVMETEDKRNGYDSFVDSQSMFGGSRWSPGDWWLFGVKVAVVIAVIAVIVYIVKAFSGKEKYTEKEVKEVEARRLMRGALGTS